MIDYMSISPRSEQRIVVVQGCERGDGDVEMWKRLTRKIKKEKKREMSFETSPL
jgi:hypothetical protein